MNNLSLTQSGLNIDASKGGRRNLVSVVYTIMALLIKACIHNMPKMYSLNQIAPNQSASNLSNGNPQFWNANLAGLSQGKEDNNLYMDR
jgi:hypothetical protein